MRVGSVWEVWWAFRANLAEKKSWIQTFWQQVWRRPQQIIWRISYKSILHFSTNHKHICPVVEEDVCFCISICIHIFMWMCICICMYVEKRMAALHCNNTNWCSVVEEDILVCICVYICTCICVCIHICICIYLFVVAAGKKNIAILLLRTISCFVFVYVFVLVFVLIFVCVFIVVCICISIFVVAVANKRDRWHCIVHWQQARKSRSYASSSTLHHRQWLGRSFG